MDLWVGEPTRLFHPALWQVPEAMNASPDSVRNASERLPGDASHGGFQDKHRLGCLSLDSLDWHEFKNNEPVLFFTGSAKVRFLAVRTTIRYMSCQDSEHKTQVEHGRQPLSLQSSEDVLYR